MEKLHRGLIRGVPFKCLPLDFMGIYALVGLEEDKRIKEKTKQYILQVRKPLLSLSLSLSVSVSQSWFICSARPLFNLKQVQVVLK